MRASHRRPRRIRRGRDLLTRCRTRPTVLSPVFAMGSENFLSSLTKNYGSNPRDQRPRNPSPLTAPSRQKNAGRRNLLLRVWPSASLSEPKCRARQVNHALVAHNVTGASWHGCQEWDSRPRRSLVLRAPSPAVRQAGAPVGRVTGEGAGPTTKQPCQDALERDGVARPNRRPRKRAANRWIKLI